ncbi:DUF1461 domain-containing protein [Candidatus Woesearchaeota archaeon]|nr:DUF1461 domain-containing protein [Candidatus Woesearchaeota archaeon]
MKIKYLLLILIPFFIILLNLNLLIFNHNLYINEVNENLINYFNNKEELNFNYTEVEVIHLNDVKFLINLSRIIVYALGILILLILIIDRDISGILIISGIITIGIIILLFLIDFNFLFTKFHEILFMNDYWLLSNNTLLIQTYPMEFFISFFKRLILNIIITSLILIGVGIYVHTQHRPGAS